MNWKDYFKKKHPINTNITVPTANYVSPINTQWSTNTLTIGGGGGSQGLPSTHAIFGAANMTAAVGQAIGTGMFTTVQQPTSVIQFQSAGKEIVKLNMDGSVTWGNDINIDAAAEAFAQSLQLGAEMRAGISNAVKLKMRDSIFEDLISIAKEKGSLSAEDLTYLLEASKIVEKLKGG